MTIGQRLTKANPVTSVGVAPDETLLARILAEPRVFGKSRPRIPRRTLATAIAILVALGGAAAGVSTLVVRYYGNSDTEPTPAAIIDAMRVQAERDGGSIGVDPESLVRVASFEGSNGTVTMYAASGGRPSDFCVVSAIDGAPYAAACGGAADSTVPWGGLTADSFGNATVLFGRLYGGATNVDVRFEDGSTKSTSTRSEFWTYVLVGDELAPGHRPTELVAKDAAGAVVATQKLDPAKFGG